MTASPAPWTPAAAVAVADPAAVDALMAASFAAVAMRPCPTCGRMDDGHGHCSPCWGNNAPPIYGATATNARIDDLLDQNDALGAEVHHLRGQVAELQAAAVRAGKGG